MATATMPLATCQWRGRGAFSVNFGFADYINARHCSADHQAFLSIALSTLGL